MPPFTDIYALSENRDRSLLETFVSKYIDREASEDREDEELMMLPRGATTDETNAEDSWEWEPSRTLSHILDRGLDTPFRAFNASGLAPSSEDFELASITFTQTGEVVFGLAVDDPGMQKAKGEYAKQVLHQLVEDLDCKAGWVSVDRPPPLDAQRIRAVEDDEWTIYYVEREP